MSNNKHLKTSEPRSSKLNRKGATGRRKATTRASESVTTLEFHEVDAKHWPDLERLFEAKGGPKYCWCMAWRATGAETNADSAERKRLLKLRVVQRVPIGILGYSDGDPVAWCSIAPRETYRSLGGPEAGDDRQQIWSLVCFYVPRQLRRRGITQELIAAAVATAKRRGAHVVEAYPVREDSPSYRFMGKVSVFKRAGFREVGRAGSRRHVMRLDLQRSRVRAANASAAKAPAAKAPAAKSRTAKASVAKVRTARKGMNARA